MKTLFLFFILVPFLMVSASENDTVIVELLKKKGKHSIRISVPNGFGIQKEAPNKLAVSGANGLQVKKADLKFKGPNNPSKPEYFKSVNEMPIQLTGSGDLEISGKVYFCDYSANVCKYTNILKKEKVD